MIKDFVSGIATQMGMKLTDVSLTDNIHVGCINVQTLKATSNGHAVSTLVLQGDIEKLKSGIDCDRLEVRVRASLLRLQMLIDPR